MAFLVKNYFMERDFIPFVEEFSGSKVLVRGNENNNIVSLHRRLKVLKINKPYMISEGKKQFVKTVYV
jgi:hypothetical protein